MARHLWVVETKRHSEMSAVWEPGRRIFLTRAIARRHARFWRFRNSPVKARVRKYVPEVTDG